ncbi:MAG: hypothetical protein KDK70_33200 [Myxococcales bacterium]|nr:hypothetical protein [Myxococcales bacterium]
MLLLAPVVWVCSLCTSDDSPAPAPAPAARPPAPSQPPPVAASPAPVEDSADARTPTPAAAHERRHRPRRSHHPGPETPERSETVDPWDDPDEASPTASDLDRALDEARSTPSSGSRPKSPIAATPSATCCRHCGPTSKPCGDSCISRSKTCHKGRGCAC